VTTGAGKAGNLLEISCFLNWAEKPENQYYFQMGRLQKLESQHLKY